AAGLATLAARDTGSIQPGNRAAGVTWTWLALHPR
ncbi:SAM-dependent methyltransferase, partial [Rhodobacterales bacterium HKCCE2091]|nr:SAM-dependent methyltransferase [Rhodobacterales bacterium HKCCE2091]